METLTYNSSHAYALEMDAQDPLRQYRNKFHLPKHTDGSDILYFCGNSLGLQPKKVEEYIGQELRDWKDFGVEGHFHAKNPWMPYHEFFSKKLSKVVGAKEKEVVVMNTLTTNLHLMMVSFYRPN